MKKSDSFLSKCRHVLKTIKSLTGLRQGVATVINHNGEPYQMSFIECEGKMKFQALKRIEGKELAMFLKQTEATK